jgi:AraC-like DNA-binding protein
MIATQAKPAPRTPPAQPRRSTAAAEHPTIALRYARKLISVVASRGFSEAALCQAAGVVLPPGDGSTRLPAADFAALWRCALRLTGDEALPFAVGLAPDDHSDDVIFHACLSAETLLAALQRFVRYLPLWTNTPGWSVRTTTTGASLVFHGAGRWNTEFSLACMIGRVREYTGVAAVPREVSVVHARPADTRAYAAAFGCSVGFEGVENAIVLDAAVLALPLVRAAPGVAAYFSTQLDEALARVQESEDWVARVRQEIADALRSQPTLHTVAATLGLSPRTLRRRLETRGTTFMAELDDVRRTHAQRLLADISRPLADVSCQVGFSEPSAFHRAFRRWTGQTPQQARDALARAGAAH